MKRKDIDNFLIELEKFIEKNSFTEDFLQYTFMPVFKWNADKIKSMQSGYEKLEIPRLVKLVNRQIQSDMKQRTDVYIRRIAYWLKYKYVRDFDYDNIFWKIIFLSTNEFKPKQIIKNHKKKIRTFLIIPEDWEHNDNIYIY